MENRLRGTRIHLKKEIHNVAGIVRSHPFECIAAALGMAFMAAIFRYIDGLSLTAWSVEIWDAVVAGRLRDFVALTAENVRGAPHGGCGLLLALIPWAIWNFPIWLIHRINGNPYIFSSACVLWSKLFLVACAFTLGLICQRIVSLISEDHEQGKVAAVLVWGSGTLIMSIGLFMQDEITYTLAFVCALYCSLSGKRASSLIWMIVCVSFAPFMLLPCILLLIYHSKRIIAILGQVILFFIPTALEKIFLIEHLSSPDDYLDWFFGSALLPGGNSYFSIFAIIVLLILARQFFNQYQTEEEKQKYLLHSIACMMTAMCLFSWLHAYRFFLCIPFLILCILTTKGVEKQAAGLTGLCIFEWFWCLVACFGVGEDYVFTSNSLAGHIQEVLGLQQGDKTSLYALLKHYIPLLSGKEFLFGSVVFACAVWLLWLTHPKQKQEIECRFSSRVILCIYSLCSLVFTALFCVLLWATYHT